LRFTWTASTLAEQVASKMIMNGGEECFRDSTCGDHINLISLYGFDPQLKFKECIVVMWLI